MEPLSPLAAAIVAIITSVIGVAVGFGAFGEETAHILIPAATTIIAAVFVVVNEIRHQTLTKAGKIR